MTAPFTNFIHSGRGAAHIHSLKPHQRVDPERFEFASFQQFGATMRFGPRSQALKRKLRPQSEFARFLRQQAFDRGRQSVLGIKVINKDDLTAGTQHPRALRQHTFRIFDQGYDELADHTVKRRIRIFEFVRIHDGQVFDERVASGFCALARTRDHWFRHIDARDFGRVVVVVKRKPGANPYLENPPAHSTRRTRGSAPPVQEDGPQSTS